MDEDNKSQSNNNVALKDLNDMSYEAKKTQLQSLMGGKSQQATYSLGDLLSSKAGSESHDAWRLFSKAKNALEDGARLENLSWRLFHMKVTKENFSDDLSTRINLSSENGNTFDDGSIKHDQSVNQITCNYGDSLKQNDVPTSKMSNVQEKWSSSTLEALSAIPLDSEKKNHSIQLESKSEIPTPKFLTPSPSNTPLDNSFGISGKSLNTSTSLSFPENISLAPEDASANLHDQKVCANCTTTNTVLWRKSDHGGVLCNACGLFFKLHGVNRPLKLKSDVIRKRNRKVKKEYISVASNHDVSQNDKDGRIPKSKSSNIKTTKKDLELDASIPKIELQDIKSEYVSTGKRGRADADQGNPYTDSTAPFMYIPTPASTLDASISIPSSLNGHESIAQSHVKPINIMKNYLVQNQNNWQSQSSPFSNGNNHSLGFYQYDSAHHSQNHENDIKMVNSYPSHYYSPPNYQPIHSYTISHFGQEPNLSITPPVNQSLNNFQKQPIYFEDTNKQSQLFQDFQQKPSLSNENPPGSIISPPVTNTLMTDIMFMSQLMSNEDPLGRASEMMVEDLYGFGNNNNEYSRNS